MKRDWSQYNEELVKRGKIYLCFDFLDNWDHEIKTKEESLMSSPTFLLSLQPSFVFCFLYNIDKQRVFSGHYQNT